MLQRNRRFKVFLNMLLEAGIIFLSYHMAAYIRFSLLNGTRNAVLESPSTELLVLLYSLGTVVLFYLFHLYRPVHQLTVIREITSVALLGFLSVLALGTALYVLRIEDFSRMMLGIFTVLFVVSLCLKRLCWHWFSQRRFARGIGVQRVVIVGSGELAQDYWKDICAYPQYGRKVVGYIGNDPTACLGKFLGTLDRIEAILDKIVCEEVVIALDPEHSGHIQSVLNAAGKEGLRVSMIPFYRAYFPRHPTIEALGRSVIIDLRATPLDNLALATLKRAFDLFGSAFLLVLFSPVMLATAIIIKLDSPGPVFFRQQRVGLNKREFTMYKFRSMRVNTEENTGWTTGGDPRRTAFGSFIRRYSIDELPQLINTLKGDMSLVGPRPEIPYYTRQFKETVPLYLVRQQVRPGMTGWAQVHGLRGDTSIEARVKYDIWYIENWTPWLDVKILWMTLLGGFISHEEKTPLSELREKKTWSRGNAHGTSENCSPDRLP